MFWANKTDPDETEEVEESTDVVKVVDTDIFFYGSVTEANILELNTQLLKLSKTLLKKSISLGSI